MTLVFLIGIIIVTSMYSCEHKKNKQLEKKLQESNNLLASSQDTLQIVLNEKGQQSARISTMETEKVQTLLELQARDKDIKWLQEIVKNNKNDLKKPGDGVIVVEGKTVFDTVYIQPTTGEEWGKKVITRGFTNEWITYSTTIRVDSTSTHIGVNNKYSLVLGTDKSGKSFADITNYNPYSTTKTLRSYQISGQFSPPKPKRWGIGPSVGYYWVDKSFKLGAGISVNYNLFQWK